MVARRPRYARIERLIEGLLDRSAVAGPRVDVRFLMESQGIVIRAGDLGEVSGLIARRGDECVVGVNRKHVGPRQRFTLAHEFGHFHLHSGKQSHSDLDFMIKYRDDLSREAIDVDEIEANFFAACLLMPKRFLQQHDAHKCLDNDGKVAELAALFDVSRHAMSLRLVNVYTRYRPY